jgi:type IV secretory pathway TrbD component
MGKKAKIIVFAIGITAYLLGAVYKNFLIFFLGLMVWLFILVLSLWRRFGDSIRDPFEK